MLRYHESQRTMIGRTIRITEIEGNYEGRQSNFFNDAMRQIEQIGDRHIFSLRSVQATEPRELAAKLTTLGQTYFSRHGHRLIICDVPNELGAPLSSSAFGENGLLFYPDLDSAIHQAAWAPTKLEIQNWAPVVAPGQTLPTQVLLDELTPDLVAYIKCESNSGHDVTITLKAKRL
jgi:hypothetical protein